MKDALHRGCSHTVRQLPVCSLLPPLHNCSLQPAPLLGIRGRLDRPPCSPTSLPALLQCEGSGNCLAFAAQDASGVLAPFRFDRRPGAQRRTCLRYLRCLCCLPACLPSCLRLVSRHAPGIRRGTSPSGPHTHLHHLPPPPPCPLASPAVGPDDVRVQITHSGICHSDLHQIKGEWGNSTFPMVPGHEIVGVVTEVGANVDTFKVSWHLKCWR